MFFKIDSKRYCGASTELFPFTVAAQQSVEVSHRAEGMERN